MKKKTSQDRVYPFRKAGVYPTREDAMKGEFGPQAAKERLADTRMAAQKLGQKIHKEEV